jgi:hypothetical protein
MPRFAYQATFATKALVRAADKLPARWSLLDTSGR